VDLTDRVEQISATITELRQAVGDGPQTRALVNSLFRTVHSFKAAASAEGLNDLSRTAHEFEDLLQSLRTGKLTLDDELLRVLDDASAALRDGSQTPSLHSFNRLTSRSLTSKDGLAAEFANLKDEERHRAISALREGAHLYVMNAVFQVSDFDERFRQLKEQLEKNAELISTSATMKDDNILFQVVYASKTEKIPVHSVLRKAILAGQAAATALGKQIEFVVRGDELLLDKSLSNALTDALLHLVRNAVDHGIESSGKVIIEVTGGKQTEITVTDDGRGIDPANVSLLFQPGFSTATEITEFSGRGVGLDVVKTAVEELGCSVSVTSEPGKGSSFKITWPNPSWDA
jgi:two-component system chemotaxis sensor kinase CheA